MCKLGINYLFIYLFIYAWGLVILLCENCKTWKDFIYFYLFIFGGEELVGGGGCKNCKLGRNFFVKNLAVGAKQRTWKPVSW